MLSSGTLDDPSWVKPTMQVYCDSAQPWMHLEGEMQRFVKKEFRYTEGKLIGVRHGFERMRQSQDLRTKTSGLRRLCFLGAQVRCIIGP
jgi:hypothetical protein